MKNIIMIGTIGAGKTTLSQALLGDEIAYEKTQAVQVRGKCILDTPGEFLERRRFQGALITTSAEAEVIVLLQDPTDQRIKYPPAFAGAFAKDVIGVITKIDLAEEKQMEDAEKKLRLAGARRIFRASAVTGDGVPELKEYLE